MSKGLEAFVRLKALLMISTKEGKLTSILDLLNDIEKELKEKDNFISRITDFYLKKELDYYADRDAFYYDYYIVLDGTHIKVDERLYRALKELCGKSNELNKCIDEY